MAQKIQLDLLLNARGADTTLAELRKQVQAANQELENTKIGTTRYAQLKAAVASANTELASQDKLIKGITSEEMAGAYARIGGGISSTFTAASAALNTFGIENEGVLKAAADAQNLLTFAISTRQIQEGLLSAKMLANIATDKIRLAVTKLTTKATNEETVAEVANTASQEANTKAKGKNVVATGADAAATGADTAVTVAATGAKGLLATATATVTAAFKAFYATLLANPLIAIVALIGLLVYAVIELADTLSQADKQAKEFRDELIKQQSEVKATEIQTLRLRNAVLTQANSEKIRLAAYKELQKTIPGLKDLTMQQAIETGKLNEAINQNIKVTRTKIFFDVASTNYGEKLVRLRTLQADREAGLNVSQKELNKATQEYNSALRVLNDATGQYNRALLSQNIFIDDNTKGKKTNSAATQKQIAQNEKIRLQLDEIARRLKDEIAYFKELGKVRETDDYTPEVLKRAEAAAKARFENIKKTENEALQFLKKIGFIQEKTREDNYQIEILRQTARRNLMSKEFAQLRKEAKETGDFIGTALTANPFLQDFLAQNVDVFGTEIVKLRSDLEDLAVAPREAFEQESQNIRNSFAKLFEEGKIGIQQLGALDVVLSNLDLLNKAINRTPSVGDIFDDASLKEYLRVQENQLIVAKELNFVGKTEEETTKRVLEAQRQYRENQIFIDKFESKLRAKIEAGLKTEIGETKKSVLEYIKRQEKIGGLAKENAAQLRQQLSDDSKFAQTINNLITQVADERIKAISNTSQATSLELAKITSVYYATEIEKLKAFQNLSASITSEIEKVPKDFMKLAQQGADGISILSGVLKINFSKILSERQKLSKAESFINDLGLKEIQFTEEEKLRIYEATFGAQREGAEKVSEDILKQFEKFIQIAQTALNAYQEYITRSEELATERITRDEQEKFKQLEKAYADGLVLEKTYQQKRTELTEEYAAQRAAIEKKYRIKQLQVDRLQAIANVALGVTRAIAEGGIAGLITGAIVAVAGGAEIRIINQQLTDAQALRRGGLIRAQGGLLVEGPSHEYGGVKFQNGGYELEGGEAVINRVSSRNYQGLLSQVNQMGGGRPLVASFDDSRIIDAIAKQRMEPIRAYVIEQDITRAQAINKRLDQLSRF